MVSPRVAYMTYLTRCLRLPVLVAFVSMGLAACGDDQSSASSTAASLSARSGMISSVVGQGSPTIGRLGTPTIGRPPSNGGGTPPSNSSVIPPTGSTVAQAAPTISGKAVTSINAGAKYQFTPTASGPSGATLIFSVQNKPEWANFDATSGTLSGTPTAANVGTYANIVVSVSDGRQTASLTAFTVSVNQVSNGTATLDWIAPTENVDGTALTNLAGYKVYYGTSARNLNESVSINNPGLTTYTLSNLSTGTWYFAVASITATGAESVPSGVVTATL